MSTPPDSIPACGCRTTASATCSTAGGSRVRSASSTRWTRCTFRTGTWITSADFDYILANKLKPPGSRLDVYGPPGTADGVRAKILAYEWNLAEPRSVVFDVSEIGATAMRRVRVSVPDDLAGEPLPEAPVRDGIVRETADYAVRAIRLDHGVPSFGYSFTEKDRVGVVKEALDGLGLRPGPWVGELKWMAETGNAGPLDVGGTLRPFEELRSVLEQRRGRKIVYLTDFGLDETTLDRLAAFAADADVLYCESNYADEEADLAKANRHLTAGQAGRIAGEAGARELVLFHFSQRYAPERLMDEARAFFHKDRIRKPARRRRR